MRIHVVVFVHIGLRACGQVPILAALALSFMRPLDSSAGTITFFDLTDTITVTDTTGRSNLPANCPSPETCFGTLTAPNGIAAAAIDVPGLNIFEPPGSSGPPVSDVLLLSLNDNTQPFTVQIEFVSDSDGFPVLDPIPGPRLIEDGTVQTASTITWFNPSGSVNTIDTIKFQSDVADVPEPSSILLLPIVFAVLGISKHRLQPRINRVR